MTDHRVDIPELKDSRTNLGTGWLTLLSGGNSRTAPPADVHNVRLDAITAWGRVGNRVTLFAGGVMYVVGSRAKQATLTEPARYEILDALVGDLVEAFERRPPVYVPR